MDPTDRFTISGTGYGLEGKVHHVAGATATIEDAILPYLMASDATLVHGKVVGDPTEGALLVLGHKAGLDIDGTRETAAPAGHPAFDPTYKLMATFNSATDAVGPPGRAVLRQGRGTGRDGPRRHRPVGRQEHPVGRRPERTRPRAHGTDGARAGG